MERIDIERGNLRRGPQSVGADSFSSYRRCSAEELADYDEGFNAGSHGHEIDATKSPAWRTGWAEAQEYVLHFSWSA
jgi:hypothetical protein